MRSAWALAIVLASTPVSRGDDWPQWLGPQRDAIWRETGILDHFPAGGPTVRWRSPVGAGYSGPAVAGDRVYLTDRVLAAGAANPKNPFQRGKVPGVERVLCLKAADGQLVWEYKYECPYTVSYPLGPRTTPVVQGGKIYTLGAEGNLVCLNADDGKLIWSRELKKDYRIPAPLWGFSGHPVLDGQKLICLVGGAGSVAVAFDKDTGKEIWKALTAKEPGYCPPMIYEAGGKRQLVIWHSESINGLDPETGNVYWSQPQPTYSGMSIATPRLRDNMLFVTGHQYFATMLRMNSEKPGAEVVWKGDRKKQTGLFSVYAAPFFDDGYIYGATSDGALGCIKASDGTLQWTTMEPNKGKKAPSGDPFLVKSGDYFFVVTELGDLLIARLTPKEYKELGRAHLLEPTADGFGRPVVWSHPAFAAKSVFMRNDKEIICVSLAAQ